MAGHNGSSWRLRGPESMDWLYRMMERLLRPECDPLTKQEREWCKWLEAGKPADVPEPPDPTKDIKARTDKPNGNPFDDGCSQKDIAQKKGAYHPANGPASVNGMAWRKPM